MFVSLEGLAASGKVRGKFELIKGVGEVQHYVSPPPVANTPSLVFIHTTGHDSEIWKNACADNKGVHAHRRKSKYCNILEQVALAGFGVYAMDLPGHGKSAKTCVGAGGHAAACMYSLKFSSTLCWCCVPMCLWAAGCL